MSSKLPAMQALPVFRNVAWIALLAIAPAVAGPGAIVATLAAVAWLDGGHAHHVSIQRDAGHVDFVFHHDSRDGVDSAGPAFEAAGGADDHRVHVHAGNAERLISRASVAQSLHGAPFALVASPCLAVATRECAAIPESKPATLVAIGHHRTIVLRI